MAKKNYEPSFEGLNENMEELHEKVEKIDSRTRLDKYLIPIWTSLFTSLLTGFVTYYFAGRAEREKVKAKVQTEAQYNVLYQSEKNISEISNYAVLSCAMHDTANFNKLNSCLSDYNFQIDQLSRFVEPNELIALKNYQTFVVDRVYSTINQNGNCNSYLDSLNITSANARRAIQKYIDQ